MRLVILSLFCFVGLTNATDSYAQSAKVTMNVRNQTVEDVLRAIEKQTEFSFFYNNAHINLKRLVTISANRNDIFKVLDEVFKNTNVEYKDHSVHGVGICRTGASGKGKSKRTSCGCGR